MERNIVHINVTSFPVGVERVVDPALRQRPVAVAASGSPRAVALAVSREAYLEGVMKGMPVGQARKFCPALAVIPPNPPLYKRAAQALDKIAARYSPAVEPWRLGHFHLDLTGSGRLFGPPVDVAARLNREIRDELRLGNTAGLAANKLVSRVASRLVRPRGLCDVFAGNEARFLAPLEVTVLPGVGDKTAMALADFNIRLVGDLAALPRDHLLMAFGDQGHRLHQSALGVDPTPVRPPERSPRITLEAALAEDSNDDARVEAALRRLAEEAGRKLRGGGRQAGSMSLEICYADHVTATRRARLRRVTGRDRELYGAALDLLGKAWTRRTGLRYLSLTLADLYQGPRQLGLFDDLTEEDRKEDRLSDALDSIRDRFGQDAILRGRFPESARKGQAA